MGGKVDKCVKQAINISPAELNNVKGNVLLGIKELFCRVIHFIGFTKPFKSTFKLCKRVSKVNNNLISFCPNIWFIRNFSIQIAFFSK